MARGPGRPFWDCGRTRVAAWRCTMRITREEAAVRSLDPPQYQSEQPVVSSQSSTHYSDIL
eukprot:scaffold17452_cov56-Phaeocystis_antarctica.AAC.3